MLTCPACGHSVGPTDQMCPECGFSLAIQSVEALPVGTQLQGGKYTVGKVLGQGGFGITYMGADQILQRPVALKEFFPQGCVRRGNTVVPSGSFAIEYNGMKTRFLQEARTLARFNHPGIVRVYEVFEENNTAYMVMEYLRGKTLSKLLEERGGAMEEVEAIGYIERICEALDEVHKAGLLHRDIKPDNIMVCEDGRVVLIDFGAAREFAAQKTQRHTVIVTSGYAPLEQYSVQGKRGPYTDIYALGATLYLLLTGVVPVAATERAAGFALKAPHEINPKVSRKVSEAVLRAMAMRVDERPQNVGEFLALLRGHLQVEPIVSTTRSWQEVVTLKGHLGGILSVAFSPGGRYLASGSWDHTVIVWAIGSWQEMATLKGHTWIVRSIVFSPDGRYLVSGSLDHTVKIWAVGSWKEVATLKGHSGGVYSAAFSPDGRYLASGSLDETLKVWAVGNWQEIAILKGHKNWVLFVAFSPDGRYLVSGSEDKTIKVWAVGSWEEVAALGGHQYAVRSIAFSPDGRYLVSGSDDKTIKVWAVGSWQEVVTLKGHRDTVRSIVFSPDGRYLVSGSVDKTIRIWAVESWQEVATLEGHSDGVTSVAFSPDGRYLASGSYDKIVKVWRVGD